MSLNKVNIKDQILKILNEKRPPVEVLQGDSLKILKTLPAESVHCCITSPPYWGLRDYSAEGQIGQEENFSDYVINLVNVFREVRRVLKPTGVLWLNLGDAYAYTNKGSGGLSDKQASNSGSFFASKKLNHGVKETELIGIPWKVAFALQDDGWYLKSGVPWIKRAAMPESTRSRPANALEYVFMFGKSAKYYFDVDSVKKSATYAGKGRGGSTNRYEQNSAGMDNKVYDERNFRNSDLWLESLESPHGLVLDDEEILGLDVNPKSFKGHHATFPEKLIKPLVLSGCPKGGTILDPFGGSGTTGKVARENERRSILIELNPDYIKCIKQRCGK